MLELYKNIKQRRLELGLTQSELARSLGYADKSMIAKIEKGSVDLPLSKIELFAEALNTTPAQLMGDTWEGDILDNARSGIVDYFDGDAFEIAKFQESEQIDASSYSETETIAAHKDDDIFTPEELQKIEEYKKLLLAARPKE